MSYIVDAEVEAYLWRENKWILFAKDKTNEYGECTLFLIPGYYRIMIRKEGFASIERYIRVERDSNLIINLPLEPTPSFSFRPLLRTPQMVTTSFSIRPLSRTLQMVTISLTLSPSR